jgi:hypothetical protein
MKKLTLLLAITFLTAGLSSAQELVGFDTYEQFPIGFMVFDDINILLEEGKIESGVMYKGEDGYGIVYNNPLSVIENTIDILTLTQDILINNNIDPSDPEVDDGEIDVDFSDYSIDDLWFDFYMGYTIRKAWGIRINGVLYVAVLQMHIYSFELSLTEFKKN